MAKKYRAKNRLTKWWQQAPKRPRILVATLSVVVVLALITGVGLSVRSWLNIQPVTITDQHTTVQLPAQGLPGHSEIPTVLPTPELPPVQFPTPTPTPTPTGFGVGADGGRTEGSSAFPNPGQPGSFDSSSSPTIVAHQPTQGELDSAAAAIAAACLSAQPVQTAQGQWYMRVSANWADGQSAQFLPCIESTLAQLHGLNIGLDLTLQAPTGVAATLLLPSSNVDIIHVNPPDSRRGQIFHFMQVKPEFQIH